MANTVSQSPVPNSSSRKNSTHQFNPPVQHHIVPTEKCGLLNVYVQVSFVHFFVILAQLGV